MTIEIIAAQSENGVIGRGADIPWKVKGEQKLFRDITMGGTLIMGRKTYDTIGRPLPGRKTIIVSRDPALVRDGCETAENLDAAISAASALEKPVFIAGGGEIYAQSLAFADTIHLTTIHTTVEGDIFFPRLPDDLQLVSEEHYSSNMDYTYRRYERNK